MRPRVVLTVIAASGCAAASTTDLKLGPIPPRVTVTSEMEYYDINAETMTQLRQGLVRGPRANGRQWEAVTQSQFHWTYTSERSANGCTARQARVHLKLKMVMPRWNPLGEPDPELVDWWAQREVGLMEHERGHAFISLWAADTLAHELEGMQNATCEGLAKLVHARGGRRVAISRRAQDDYDRSTRHGATQIEQAGRLRSPDGEP